MSKLATLRPQGNPSTIYARFNDPLDRTEAQRAGWLDYRVRRRKFESDPTLANAIKAVAARDRWSAAFKARWS